MHECALSTEKLRLIIVLAKPPRKRAQNETLKLLASVVHYDASNETMSCI